MRNERTGKKAASIAGLVLKRLERAECIDIESLYRINDAAIITVRELKTLCASALTQSTDKPKRKTK